MVLTALILFGLAIALWRHSHRQSDEVGKLLELITALMSLMIGLAIAPFWLKMLSLISLLVYPVCTSAERVLKPDCPRFCLLRSQCRKSRQTHFPS
ncbi:MAG: hypothetical protein AAFX78_00035 [Cyanobacteria bacterium J06638_20]